MEEGWWVWSPDDGKAFAFKSAFSLIAKELIRFSLMVKLLPMV